MSELTSGGQEGGREKHKEQQIMKTRMGAALAVAAILTGGLLPAAVLADDSSALPAEPANAAAASRDLQQELEARVQKDAEAVAADAMTAAGNLDLPLEFARTSPGTLVLVSDL